MKFYFEISPKSAQAEKHQIFWVGFIDRLDKGNQKVF